MVKVRIRRDQMEAIADALAFDKKNNKQPNLISVVIEAELAAVAPKECKRCGLSKETCEMQGGDDWVSNCMRVQGQAHDFGTSAPKEEWREKAKKIVKGISAIAQARGALAVNHFVEDSVNVGRNTAILKDLENELIDLLASLVPDDNIK